VTRPLHLAVARDFRAELWPSMDLVADQLLANLPATIAAEVIAPNFRRLLSRLPFARRAGFNADRLVNRHLLLPRAARRVAGRFDFVHVVDHTYAHVVNSVPSGRAGVYCHDLDAFRCLLEPEQEPRPWWFRKLANRTLDGLKQAAVVFHSTHSVGNRLLDRGIVAADRLVYAPYGVAAEFVPDPPEVELPLSLGAPFLLHVGGNMPRKRLDVLLSLMPALVAKVPTLRLVQVGGPWPTHLAMQIASLGIERSVTQIRGLSREQLAQLYRQASAVLIPSEAEGFGLPVIEALACGAVVIASDIPTLREVGGDATLYCPVADIPAWVEATARVLLEPSSAPPLQVRLANAARFTWHEHARIIAEAYLALASGGR
jgi:glycosyltransferase involved in cell wall biosynthesis